MNDLLPCKKALDHSFWSLIERLIKRLLLRGDHYDGLSNCLLPLATSRQEAFLNCMDVKHLCSSQEEVDTRLFLHSLDSVRKGPTELYMQAHISLFHRKQEARNITGTGGQGTRKELQHCPTFRMTL